MIKDFSTNGVIRTYILYNGEVTMEFNENGHRYTIDGIEKVGVTTILKTVIAKEALVNWAVKLCAESIIANIKPDTKYTTEELMTIVNNAKKAHRTVKEASADIGTRVHAFLEEYIRAKIVKRPVPDMPVEPDMFEPVNSFLTWEKQNKIEWLESERTIYSKSQNFCGTLDALAMVNGIRTIIDIKTSNAIYPESYYLQISAYRFAYEEEFPNNKIQNMIIIKVPKNNKSQLEVVTVNDYVENAKAFIYAVYLYRQVVKLKNFNK